MLQTFLRDRILNPVSKVSFGASLEFFEGSLYDLPGESGPEPVSGGSDPGFFMDGIGKPRSGSQGLTDRGGNTYIFITNSQHEVFSFEVDLADSRPEIIHNQHGYIEGDKGRDRDRQNKTDTISDKEKISLIVHKVKQRGIKGGRVETETERQSQRETDSGREREKDLADSLPEIKYIQHCSKKET